MRLNDKIWINGKLIPSIKERLLLIANKVVSDLEIDVNLKHVLFTGSLASYRWRPSSDIDLHIIVEPVETGFSKLADEYFKIFSKMFNEYYDIYIKSYEVEINVKTEEVVLDDKGIFDLLTDTWIQKPSSPKKEFSDPDILTLAKKFQNMIDELVNNNSSLEEAEKLRKLIRKLRTDGLVEGGEFSLGNMTFKELRHSGYLRKLYDFKQTKENEDLSYESFRYFHINNK